MLEVYGQGVKVNALEVPKADLMLVFGAGGGEWQLHWDGVVVRHTQIIHKKVVNGDGVWNDQVQSMPLGVCGDINMLLEVKTVQ